MLATNAIFRLLIVDDDPNNIRLLASIFDDEHHEILFATNGSQAIQIALKEQPDLILLDVMMPEIDGYEVCRFLKEDLLTKSIPIIFVTSHSDTKEEIIGLEAGAADYISKPFCPAIVKIRVHNQIELKHAREQLTRLVITDGLTNIPNRRCFDQQLEHEWQRASRMNQSLAVAMIDVDWFKKYNDHYGHQAGDDCLRQVAMALTQGAKRASDFVARYGGEEFVLILPTTQHETALMVVENICRALSNLALPHELSEFGCVTISAGVAVYVANECDSAESLMKNADKALYTAKNQGRNQAVLYQRNQD
ncbi:MAG: diguanylate cyclase [Methylococcales bacterium]